MVDIGNVVMLKDGNEYTVTKVYGFGIKCIRNKLVDSCATFWFNKSSRFVMDNVRIVRYENILRGASESK